MALQDERMEIHPRSVVSMISRKEMPSIPSTYPAPMEGIQLLGAPSMNLNPGSKRCAQNQGTSGIETSSPAREKRFAIQRMASFCSFGTNRSKRAPASGVNKMIERIWLCMFYTVTRARAPAPHNSLSPGIVSDESHQSHHHHQCIPLHQTPLQQPHRI